MGEKTERKLRRRGRTALLMLLIIAAALWINNTSLFSDPPGRPLLLAHRGLGQTFDLEGVGADTCTAELIHEPGHPYLENTLPSMQAAFDAGADIVEFDLHPTTDGQFAVFHDWTLECRTEGTGGTRDHTLAELQRLDVGYGYTADGGRTFPFRGKGVGMMPSLDQVLEAFPGRQLLLNPKSDDPEEGRALARRLAQLPDGRLEQLSVYGGDALIAEVAERLPDVRVMSRGVMERCLGWYIGVGWTGYVPESCRGVQLHLPEGIARWMWGWPHKFVDRMSQRDARVVVVAGSGGFSEGFDTPEDVERLPEGFSGAVWTNRIDVVAPLVSPKD